MTYNPGVYRGNDLAAWIAHFEFSETFLNSLHSFGVISFQDMTLVYEDKVLQEALEAKVTLLEFRKFIKAREWTNVDKAPVSAVTPVTCLPLVHISLGPFDWECVLCKSPNGALAQKCKKCFTFKKESPPATATEEEEEEKFDKDDSDRWQCARCENVNDCIAFTCQNCFAPNDKLASKNIISVWECNLCKSRENPYISDNSLFCRPCEILELESVRRRDRSIVSAGCGNCTSILNPEIIGTIYGDYGEIIGWCKYCI